MMVDKLNANFNPRVRSIEALHGEVEEIQSKMAHCEEVVHKNCKILKESFDRLPALHCLLDLFPEPGTQGSATLNMGLIGDQLEDCGKKLKTHITVLRDRLNNEIKSKDESCRELQEGVTKKGNDHAAENEQSIQKFIADERTSIRNLTVAREGLRDFIHSKPGSLIQVDSKKGYRTH